MRRRGIVTFAVVAVVAAVIWWRPLFHGETFVMRDHATATLPSRAYLGEALREGRVPEWWPGIGLGVPFAANPNHGVTYPPAWIAGLLPPAYAADLLLVLHAILGGLGVALLARRLGADAAGERLAGAAFVASGYVGAIVVNAIPLLTLAWTPWVAWATDRLVQAERGRVRATLLVSALFAAQIASGDPAGLLSSGLVALAVAVARAPRVTRLLALAPALAGAIALAAVAVLPALALLGESQRAGAGLGAAEALSWSLHPVRVLELVWPGVLGDATDAARDLAPFFADSGGPGLGPSWAVGHFVGVPILAAALAGRRARGGRVLLGASLFLLLLALGRFTPIYSVWRTIFVPERFIRYPEKHLAGALVLWCALAGPGLAQLLGAARRGVAVGLGVTAAILVAALLALAAGILPPLPVVDGAGALAEISAGGLTALVSVAGLALAIALARRQPAAATWLAFAVAVGPMVAQSWRLQLLADRDVVTGPPSFLVPRVIPPGGRADWPRLYRAPHAELAPHGDPAARHVAELETGLMNVATPYHVAYVPGYDPALPSRLRRLWDELAEAGGGTRLFALLGVDWVVMQARLAPAGLRPVAVSADGQLVLAPAGPHRPRAFVTARWARLAGERAVGAALLARGPFDPWRALLVGAPAAASDGPAAACDVTSGPPERVTIRCSAARPSLVVLVDSWSPGWSATVDGRPAPIELVDGVLRGVMVAAGAHEIRFGYRTPGLRTGLIISALAALVALILSASCRRRMNESSGPCGTSSGCRRT